VSLAPFHFVLIGTAVAGDSESPSSMIDRADRAMCSDKAAGRNCCAASGGRCGEGARGCSHSMNCVYILIFERDQDATKDTDGCSLESH